MKFELGEYDIASRLDDDDVVQGLAVFHTAKYSANHSGTVVHAVVETLALANVSIRAVLALSEYGCLSGSYSADCDGEMVTGGVELCPIPDDPMTWRGEWTLSGQRKNITISRRSLGQVGVAA